MTVSIQSSAQYVANEETAVTWADLVLKISLAKLFWTFGSLEMKHLYSSPKASCSYVTMELKEKIQTTVLVFL